MPPSKKPKKCKCGETDPSQFYRTHTQCKKCTAKYNAAKYQTTKSQLSALRKSRLVKNNDRCIETPGMSVCHADTFFKFCAARREIKKVAGFVIPNCGDCGLGGRVDGGFLPVNIIVLSGV